MNEAAAPPTLQRRLQTHLLSRLVFATVLLAAAVLLNIQEVGVFEQVNYAVISALVIALYATTLASAAVLRRRRSELRLVGLAHVQVMVDALVLGVLVLETGGLESMFIALWFLTIFAGANLLQRRGALLAAVLASVILLIITLAQSLLPKEWLPDALLGDDSGRQLPYFMLFVNISSFFLVGVLTGLLSQRLSSTTSALAKTYLDAQELRHLHENLVRSLTVGLITTDEEDRVTYLNPAGEALLGERWSRVDGQPFNEAFATLADVIEGARQGSGSVTVELDLELESGKRRPLAVVETPLLEKADTRAGRVVQLSDMTIIRALQDGLARQQRLAAIGQLSAAIAHEIRNPLAAISGSVQMLARGANPSEVMLLDIVRREIDRLNSLVEQFLSYARPRELRLAPLRLDVVAREVATLYAHDETLLPPLVLQAEEAVEIVADPGLVQQVVWNLVRNAAQAVASHKVSAEDRGAVWLRVGKNERKEGDVRARIEVMDAGPGLSKEARERLFEPFFTTKAQGTGLGLATCYQIVEAHGGELRAEERPDGASGALFVVELPLQARGPDARRLGTATLRPLMPSGEPGPPSMFSQEPA